MGNSIDKEKVISGLENTAEYFRHLQTVGFFGDQPIFREHETHCNNALALLKEREAVVRCKDCKHGEECVKPHKDYWCNLHDTYQYGDWFCADGERR